MDHELRATAAQSTWTQGRGRTCSPAGDAVDGDSVLSRHADSMDDIQLGLANRLLIRSRKALAATYQDGAELSNLTADLSNALRDTLHIARSRDAALSCPPPTYEYRSAELRAYTMTRIPGDDYSAARVARHHVRDAARTWKLSPQSCDDLETVAGELVANALEHGSGGTLALTCALTASAVTLGVTEEGNSGALSIELTPPGPPRPDAEHGRGLLIVEALATRWGSRRTATGLTVWAELSASSASPEPA
ncbi:ATP-binding protein [Streptomyces sp. NPDC102467]|uniref:ATP-binding protein n=1 Tax=Streptomyces sp. NPDC102467 TaxID=3366179 RepID=UPI00380AA527